MDYQAESDAIRPAQRHLDRNDILAIFEATPSPYLILTPTFDIVAVNDAYLQATTTQRHSLIGQNLFQAFPDNPDDPHATGEENLRSSLEQVRDTKRPHRMAIQKYDIQIASKFEEKYWSPLNTPVLDENGGLKYIIHHVADVTAEVHAKRHSRNLERSEAHFRKIANVMPQIIWIAGEDGLV